MLDSVVGAGGGYRFAPNADVKAEKEKAFLKCLDNYVDYMECRMTKNKWCNIAGNSLSVADFCVAHLYFTYTHEK